MSKKRLAANKRRQSVLVYSALAAVLAAALLFALLRPQGGIRLENGKLTGVGENWLVAKVDGNYQKIGEIAAPQGYHAMPAGEGAGAETEYYFAPDDEASPVRYLYYASAPGQAAKLAQVAYGAYGSYYQEYQATEMNTEEIAGREAVWFSFTCKLSQGELPYQQSLLSYYPAAEGRASALSIVSLRFSAPAYLEGDELRAYLTLAAENLL